LEWERVPGSDDEWNAHLIGFIVHDRIGGKQLQRQHLVDDYEPSRNIVSHLKLAFRKHDGGDGQQWWTAVGNDSIQQPRVLSV
jgi:hypothetical protein